MFWLSLTVKGAIRRDEHCKPRVTIADISEMKLDKDTVLVFCPKCKQETFYVKPENTGKGYNYEFSQPEYWFDGEGKCSECDYTGYYSDSSL